MKNWQGGRTVFTWPKFAIHRKNIPILITTAFVLVIFTAPISCGRTSIPTTPPDDSYSLSPQTGDTQDAQKLNIRTTKPSDDPIKPDNPDNPIIPIAPAGDFSGESIGDLASALFFLKETGGGVTSIPMDPDQFAVHIWDVRTLANLEGDLLITCEGGPTTLVAINGWQVFENATFPLSITANVTGYALASIVRTSANVISLAMEPLTGKGTATVFGNAQNLGFDTVEIYTDTLIPFRLEKGKSKINPDYNPYDFGVTAGENHSFSAFLRMDHGNPVFGNQTDGDPDKPYYASGFLFKELEPLNPGDKRFVAINFNSKPGPSGTVDVTAEFPLDFWDAETMTGGALGVQPMGILFDSTRYLALGPKATCENDDPAALEFKVDYFTPTFGFERTVMAGYAIGAGKASDIVHRDWHPGSDVDDLVFSGYPTLDVITGTGPGIVYPQFSWVNPISSGGNLIGLGVYRDHENPVWFITLDGGTESLDTVDLHVPLTWFTDLPDFQELYYRVWCIKSQDQGIDEYNDEATIKARDEICFSAWISPGI